MFRYKVVLDSDAEQYYGHKRIDPTVQYFTVPEPWDNRRNNMHVCFKHKCFFIQYVLLLSGAEPHDITTSQPYC